MGHVKMINCALDLYMLLGTAVITIWNMLTSIWGVHTFC